MNKTKITLQELKMALGKVPFLLTRFTGSQNPDDLDILVRKTDFSKVVSLLKKAGFEIFSHDHALGGRIPGMQVNATKNGLIKIDLHQDFTWRRWRYVDLDFIWNTSSKNQSSKDIDVFLIVINILFEKTYLEKSDFVFLQSNKSLLIRDNDFLRQAEKYGWKNSYTKFLQWLDQNEKRKDYPIFLPVSLFFYSTWEKFVFERSIDLKSFAYYLFFRSRYLINKKLPYS